MTPLVGLALATVAFIGTHLLMSHPWRAPLVARLGERGFAGAYVLVSFATFGWMIFAWPPPGTPYWYAPDWWWLIASALMLFASILLVGSLLKNPAFPKPGAPPRAIGDPKGVFAITRHPMNWSFAIWAAVHIVNAGDPRNLIVAGGILFLALAGSVGQDAKKEKLLGEVWRGWEAKTSFVPFGAALAGKVRWRDAVPGLVSLVGGVILWAVVTSYHAPMASPLGDLLSR
jgi:uncharacterized membrane protein